MQLETQKLKKYSGDGAWHICRYYVCNTAIVEGPTYYASNMSYERMNCLVDTSIQKLTIKICFTR